MARRFISGPYTVTYDGATISEDADVTMDVSCEAGDVILVDFLERQWLGTTDFVLETVPTGKEIATVPYKPPPLPVLVATEPSEWLPRLTRVRELDVRARRVLPYRHSRKGRIV